MNDLFIQKKVVDFNEKKLVFRGLSTKDLFILLDKKESFIMWLFEGIELKNKEEFTSTVFTKFPDILALILALTCINLEEVANEKEISLATKIELFTYSDITPSLNAINAVVDLTFRDDVAETVKKWKAEIEKLMSIFFKTKEEIQR